MTNRLEWDLVDGVSEYHILKYDNPNYNEATWENHIVATVNDNHYEIDENDTYFYAVAYEKDNIIVLSNTTVNYLNENNLVCDITVNVDTNLANPSVYYAIYPITEHITENTGKATYNFYNSRELISFIGNKNREYLCRYSQLNDEAVYVEYTNSVPFGTDNFVIEFGIATIRNHGWISLCEIGNFQLLINDNEARLGLYYGKSWLITISGYHTPSKPDYHKVKIVRENGVFSFYHNDFLVYENKDKKSDIINDKFYIGNKSRTDNTIYCCMIDYVKINNQEIKENAIVGKNWQYINGSNIRYGINYNDNGSQFVIRLKEILYDDFTIVMNAYVHEQWNDGRDTNYRSFLDISGMELSVNLKTLKIVGMGANVYYNEYTVTPTYENKPLQVVYTRSNGVVYIFINNTLICSKETTAYINEIFCRMGAIAFNRLQIFKGSNLYNKNISTTIKSFTKGTIRFTNVSLKEDSSSVRLEWKSDVSAQFTLFRDGEKIATTNENFYVDDTIVHNKQYTYYVENGKTKSNEHIVYTHKYNPFYNAIGMDLYNNDGHIWDFRSTNTYLQDNDKTKQKALYELKPFYENKKGFGHIGGNSVSNINSSLMNNYEIGLYNLQIENIENFTFEVTINPNRFFTERDMVIMQMIGYELTKFYEVYFILSPSRNLFVRVLDERKGVNSVVLFTTTQSLNLNTWYNIVLTKSGGTYTLYIDGVMVNTATTTAELGNVSVFIGASCRYIHGINMIFDFISLRNDVLYNGSYSVSKSLENVSDNHLLYIDFENGWEDKSQYNHKNLCELNSYIGYAEYKDNWFTSIDRNEIGSFYYHWESISYNNMSAMFEFDYITTGHSSFFKSSLAYRNSASLISVGAGVLRYFHNYDKHNTRSSEYIRIRNTRIKARVLLERYNNSDVLWATLFINGIVVRSVPHYENSINRMLHNISLFDNGMAGYISNFRVYTNIDPLLNFDRTKNIGFTYNSKIIDYRCAINKNSIIIDDTNPNNVYDVYDDLGTKILDGVKKGTHTCTIEREKYKIIERNSELSFDKWIELDDEHWDNVVFYHRFGNENDEKFNHPMQSRSPLIFENGVLSCSHAVIHTRAFDIGTSDFTIEIELKTSFKTEKQETIITINSMYESTAYGNFALNFNGGLYMADYNGSINASWNIANNAGANFLSNMEWRSVVIMRKNGVLTYSVDGVEMWRTNSTHNIRPHYARNIVLGYNHEMVMFRKFRITKSARF